MKKLTAYVIALIDWPQGSEEPTKVFDVITGESNAEVEELFNCKYGSNDYGLSYDDLSHLPRK